MGPYRTPGSRPPELEELCQLLLQVDDWELDGSTFRWAEFLVKACRIRNHDHLSIAKLEFKGSPMEFGGESTRCGIESPNFEIIYSFYQSLHKKFKANQKREAFSRVIEELETKNGT